MANSPTQQTLSKTAPSQWILLGLLATMFHSPLWARVTDTSRTEYRACSG